MSYTPPPKELEAFPEAVNVKGKNKNLIKNIDVEKTRSNKYVIVPVWNGVLNITAQKLKKTS